MPYFVPDIYHSEFSDKVPPLDRLTAARSEGVVGAILKSSDGPYAHSWFSKTWKAFPKAAPARYGIDWLRGAYHFVRWEIGWREQADAMLKAIRDGGGYNIQDMVPFIDIEAREKVGGGAIDPSAEHIVDTVTNIAHAVSDALGKPCAAYGYSLVIDKGITSEMGCPLLWHKTYDTHYHAERIKRLGRTRAQAVCWQYVGDEETYPHAFPRGVPGFKSKMDMNVLMGRGDDEMENLDACRAQITGVHQAPSPTGPGGIGKNVLALATVGILGVHFL